MPTMFIVVAAMIVTVMTAVVAMVRRSHDQILHTRPSHGKGV